MKLPPHKFEEVMFQRITRKDVNKHFEGLVKLLELYVDEFIAMGNDIRHSCMEKCHRQYCMVSTQSSPHSKSWSIMF